MTAEVLKGARLEVITSPSKRSRSVASSDAPRIVATPYLGRDPALIAPRPWVMGRWLLRKTVSAIVAPGGVGKSKFIAGAALSLSTGRSLLGKAVWKRPQRAWIWNLEDDGDELAREIEGAAMVHRIGAADWGDRLFVDSGLDGARLCTAIEGEGGFEIVRPTIDALTAELMEREIDVLFVDPFVSSHQVDENHNGAIDAIAKEWARVATAANCSIVLSHHTKKPGGQKITAELARGASALINAARVAMVLNRMDTEEGKRFAIEGDAERRRYFSVQDDKHNRAPAEAADWFRLESVDLGNAEEGQAYGDSVGVVTPWNPPDPFDGISEGDIYRVQVAVADGAYKASVQAKDWVGLAIAQVLDIDVADDAAKARVKSLLRTWLKNGALVESLEKCPTQRRDKTFVRVGEWVVNT